jgi:hypothetical protein
LSDLRILNKFKTLSNLASAQLPFLGFVRHSYDEPLGSDEAFHVIALRDLEFGGAAHF